MSSCVVYVCDRCQGPIGIEDDREPGRLQLIIPADMTGEEHESHAPALNYCPPCQPMVAALLAGLFSADVIATRPEREIGHGERWEPEPIDLNAALRAYVGRPRPQFAIGGAGRGE